MAISEKVAYLKGLADGMKLDADKDTNKLILAMIDTLDEMAALVDEIDEDLADAEEHIDEVDECLADVEDIVYGDECCDDDCCCGDFYEITCPGCGETITIDDGILDDGAMDCPNCGKKLEFDLDFDDDEADD